MDPFCGYRSRSSFFNVISIWTRIFSVSMFSRISVSASGSNSLREVLCTWILSLQPVLHSVFCSHGDWTSAQGHRCQAGMPSPWQFAQHSTVISLAGISIFATCWLIQLHLLSPCHPKDWTWTYFVFLQAAGHLISWHHWTTKSSQEVTWFRLLFTGIPIVNCWRWMGFVTFKNS